MAVKKKTAKKVKTAKAPMKNVKKAKPTTSASSKKKVAENKASVKKKASALRDTQQTVNPRIIVEMMGEYRDLPGKFQDLPEGHLTFIHGRNLDLAHSGMDLICRATVIEHRGQGILVVKLSGRTFQPLSEGDHIFLGAAGLGSRLANAYVHKIEGDYVYIGCMSSEVF